MRRPVRATIGLILLLSLFFQLAPIPVSGKPAAPASPKRPKKRPLDPKFKENQQHALDSLKEAKVLQL